jgi:hypothetical protein
LHVKTTGDWAALFGNDTAAPRAGIWAGGSGTAADPYRAVFGAYDSNTQVRLNVGGSDYLTVATNGNVGIGTTSPTEKLVVGSNTGANCLMINDIDTAEWKICTGNYDISFKNDYDNNGTYDTRLTITEGGRLLPQSGIFFPNAFDARSEVQGGNVLSFGHPGVSEDQIYYRDNTFYFKDSPGGGDTADPNVDVGGNLKVGGTLGRSRITTTISLKCAWDGINGVGSCTPPSCPSGWTDLGIGNSINSVDSEGVNNYYAGHSERMCGNNQFYEVISLKCVWTNFNGVGSCTPPSCPSGWTDLGIGNTATGIDTTPGYAGYLVVGNSKRICGRD